MKSFSDIKFDGGTPERVVDIIWRAIVANREHYQHNPRLRFIYGDTATGKPWGDESDGYYGAKDEGYVSLSSGSHPIPIILHNRRSMGGGGLLTSSIVKIEHCNKQQGGVLYDITPQLTISRELQNAVDYTLSVMTDEYQKVWAVGAPQVVLGGDNRVGVRSNGLTLWYLANQPGPGSRIYRPDGIQLS